MWYVQSTGSMICLAAMILIFTKLGQYCISPANILVFVFGFGCLFFLAQLLITGERVNFSPKMVGGFFAAAVLSYVGNLLYVKALATSPNPGYVSAIVGAQAVLIAIASVYLFGSSFSLPKAGGLFLCIVGVALLVTTNAAPCKTTDVQISSVELICRATNNEVCFTFGFRLNCSGDPEIPVVNVPVTISLPAKDGLLTLTATSNGEGWVRAQACKRAIDAGSEDWLDGKPVSILLKGADGTKEIPSPPGLLVLRRK